MAQIQSGYVINAANLISAFSYDAVSSTGPQGNGTPVARVTNSTVNFADSIYWGPASGTLPANYPTGDAAWIPIFGGNGRSGSSTGNAWATANVVPGDFDKTYIADPTADHIIFASHYSGNGLPTSTAVLYQSARNFLTVNWCRATRNVTGGSSTIYGPYKASFSTQQFASQFTDPVTPRGYADQETPGSLAFATYGGAAPPLNVDVLVVAGGGGGASAYAGGGGGAGGYLSFSTTATSGTPYGVTVGLGGSGGSGTGSAGSQGGSSSAFGQTAIGGGAGAGGSGGSGGGGRSGAVGGLGVAGQGNNANGGGGGGAGAASTGYNGAVGLQWLDGNYYAGGGAGADYPNYGTYSGGTGGGGYSAIRDGRGAAAGTAGTGGGGGAGSGGDAGGETGGAGGSGVVIIRYAGAPSAVGGTITQSGGYTYHTFTTSGSFIANYGTGGEDTANPANQNQWGINNYFNSLKKSFNNRSITEVSITVCHVSCHSSCHGSRGRR